VPVDIDLHSSVSVLFTLSVRRRYRYMLIDEFAN
jgi:hypothetical protein